MKKNTWLELLSPSSRRKEVRVSKIEGVLPRDPFSGISTGPVTGGDGPRATRRWGFWGPYLSMGIDLKGPGLPGGCQ